MPREWHAHSSNIRATYLYSASGRGLATTIDLIRIENMPERTKFIESLSYISLSLKSKTTSITRLIIVYIHLRSAVTFISHISDVKHFVNIWRNSTKPVHVTKFYKSYLLNNFEACRGYEQQAVVESDTGSFGLLTSFLKSF